MLSCVLREDAERILAFHAVLPKVVRARSPERDGPMFRGVDEDEPDVPMLRGGWARGVGCRSSISSSVRRCRSSIR